MAVKAKPVPDGYRSVTACLCIQGASGAIDFYTRAFGALEMLRLPGPDETVGHSELQIGDTRIMLSEDLGGKLAEFPLRSPAFLGGTSVGLHIYMADVDAAVPRAVKAGAILRRPLQDQIYGDRSATLEDPYGHLWTLATHIKDVTLEEMDRRQAALLVD